MIVPVNAKNERAIIFGILGLAVALRVVAAIAIPDQSHALVDAVAYRDSAALLLKNWQMSNLYQMPLYPLLIAITGPGIAQLVADIVLSVISVWLVYALTGELFADAYSRIFACAAAACYPPLVFFAVVGLSETLFITLVLAAFLYWYRGRFTLAAFFAVLAVLTRPVFDLFAPLLVLVFALVVHRLPVRKALQHLGVYFLVYCALMTPWWFHNYRAYGSFVRLTPGAGVAFYAGNNSLNHSGGGNLGVDYDLSAFADITDPIERDRALRNAAIDYVVHNPHRFLELAALKFFRIWEIVPVNAAYRSPGIIILSIASFVPLLVLAGLGLLVRRHNLRQLSPILLFGLCYVLVHMILVGTIRYRLPLEPFLIVFAGAGLSYLLQTLRPTLAISR
jgi:4-amino-4-deoxy-L-arabinose transferase-like glycosyltransferase